MPSFATRLRRVEGMLRIKHRSPAARIARLEKVVQQKSSSRIWHRRNPLKPARAIKAVIAMGFDPNEVTVSDILDAGRSRIVAVHGCGWSTREWFLEMMIYRGATQSQINDWMAR